MTNPFDPGYYLTEELRGFGFAHIGESVSISRNCTIVGVENISVDDHSAHRRFLHFDRDRAPEDWQTGAHPFVLPDWFAWGCDLE